MAPFVEGLKQQPPAVDGARGRDFCTVLQLLARLAEFSTVQFEVCIPPPLFLHYTMFWR